MSTKVQPLGIRLFLEGVEVPVISAQVNAAPDRPATAAIQIVPTDMAMHLLPRTLVHLFYLDPYGDDDTVAIPTGNTRQAQDGSFQEANFNRFDSPDGLYKLMFVGEVGGFNYSKSPDGRQIVLQCHDLSTYWDTCYQWFADYSVGGGGLTDKHQLFNQSGTSLFNSVAGGHKWVIGQIMSEAPTPASGYSKTKGLLGSVVHLLETIGGTSGKDGFNGVNDFFTIAQLRYNLLGMLGAIEEDDTSARIYNQKAFFSWLRNGMTSMGSIVSFRDIINQVNRWIYHHIYPNVCPKIDLIGGVKAVIEKPAVYARDTVLGRRIIGYCKLTYTALNKIIVLDGTILNQATAFQHLREAKRNLSFALQSAEDLNADVVNKNDLIVAIRDAQFFVDEGLVTFSNIGYDEETASLRGFGEATEGIEAGNIGHAAQELELSLASATEGLDKNIISLAADAKKGSTKRKTVQVDTTIVGSQGARLYNQLILPECYFVAPPRCNVLFPDQYYQFSFSRNFMREVTRMSMASGTGMISGGGRQGSKLFTRSYFAPNTVGEKNVFATTSRGARILLPHEVHSGIIPKYEWANDGHRWANLAKKNKQKDPFFGDGRVGYLQRLANFQFYLHRWSARTMAVTGVFNPHLVIGFPGLVIDQSLPNPKTLAMREELLGRKWQPVQYLGKTVALSHSISQGGGQTSVQFTHCRTHRGLDDEFLSATKRKASPKFDTVNVNITTRDLLPSNDFTREARALRLPITLDRMKLVDLYLRGELSEGVTVKEAKTWRGYKVDSLVVGDSTGFTAAELSELGIFPSSFTGSGEVFREGFGVSREVPESFDIVLKRRIGPGTPVYTEQTVEQLLTPGWFADLWTNKNISEKVYQPLLGTDAIVANISLGVDKQDEFFNRTVRDEATRNARGAPEEDETQPSLTGIKGAVFVDGLDAVSVLPGSIEEAIDALVTIYSTIRLNNGNLHEFIRKYTYRPVANMEEILGTYGLEFTDDGFVLVPDEDNTPVEGFHSRAFGDYNTDVKFSELEDQDPVPGKNALKALFPGASGAEVRRARLTDKKKMVSISPEMDPRGRARLRVLAYIQELNLSRGLMG